MVIRQSVHIAACWRVLTELMRRHGQKHDLRLLRTHPCSGQYDCLSVYALKEGNPFGLPLCDFNLPAGTVHRFAPLVEGAVPAAAGSRFDLTEDLLGGGDPRGLVDEVEKFLGWPSFAGRLPSETPAVLALRLIADLLERTSLRRFPLEADCVWQDDSYGASVQAWGAAFPAVKAALGKLPDGAPWERQMRVAARFWAVAARSASSADPRRVVLDLKTGEAWGEGFHLAAFQEFQAGKERLIPVLHKIEAHLLG